MAAMILLTGATGYIGSLLRVLEETGCTVRSLARRPERGAPGRATTEVVSADCLDEASLRAAILTEAFAYRHRAVRASVGRARRAARRWATAAIVLAAAAALQTTAAAQVARPVGTVPFVDLDRYVGDWFEIARFPNRFQRQCVSDVRASYARRADGRLDVVNQCRTGDRLIQARGIARVVDDRTFARLKVRFAPAWLAFLPFVWGDYWIIGLAEDYSWAVVGSPDREYLWILARTPRLDEERGAAARGVARANGFDVERLIQTAHEGSRR